MRNTCFRTNVLYDTKLYETIAVHAQISGEIALESVNVSVNVGVRGEYAPSPSSTNLLAYGFPSRSAATEVRADLPSGTR